MGRGDDLTSPELQERLARDHCGCRGYDPLRWVRDVDMNGRFGSTRAGLRMIDAGEEELIVVPTWFRFTRHLSGLRHASSYRLFLGRTRSSSSGLILCRWPVIRQPRWPESSG